MFIQLTRIDGLPIWINASFVVTVEPSRSGGSIVVPIGDGFDYDVREAPETVLALLKEAPPAKVVPVRQPKALTPTPDDVSPDRGCDIDVLPEAAPAKKKAVDDAPAAAEAKKPAAKRGRGRRSKKADSAAAEASAEQSAAAPQPAPPQDDVLPEGFDEIVADLKARKCRTARRMRNAIKSYFGKTNDVEIDRIIETMINRGLMLIGADGHITWSDQS